MSNETNLSYTGNVSVKLLINDKVVEINDHNLGLPYLMKAFAKFVTGNYSGESDIPQFLDLRKFVDTEGVQEWETSLNQRVPLSGRLFEYNEKQSPPNWIAKFTGVINHSVLKDTILEDSLEKYRIYLYSGYDSSDSNEHYHDIAYLNISAKDLARIVPGTQAIIEWVMQVKNPE